MHERALVLFSGAQDSTTAFASAQALPAGGNHPASTTAGATPSSWESGLALASLHSGFPRWSERLASNHLVATRELALLSESV